MKLLFVRATDTGSPDRVEMGQTASQDVHCQASGFGNYICGLSVDNIIFFTKYFTVPSRISSDAFLRLCPVMEQTFVLKLVRELNVKTGSAQGHVEDVRTGEACRFHSISELLEFLEHTVNPKGDSSKR
jgi:hypothetical protein